MYPVKKIGRRRSLGLAASAIAVGLSVDCAQSQGQSVYNSPNFGAWNSPGNWTPNGVPGAGSVAEILKGYTVLYSVQATSAPDLQSLMLSGGTSASPAELLLQTSPTLYSGSIYLGSANVPSGTGPGEIVQNTGSINLIDPNGLLAIDSTSVYSLSGTGTLIAFNEQNAGIFTENNGSNRLAVGSTLNTSGTYSLLNSGILGADTITNTGLFNQSGASSSVHGTTTDTNFSNSGTYFYNTGSFTGLMTNNPGSLVSITGAIIPFTQGIINNGQMTVTSVTGTYNGPITGTGNLVFTGATDNVTLAGTNAFTGPTTITGGTLTLAGPVGTAANNFGGGLQGTFSVSTGATLQTSADFQIPDNDLVTINGGTFNLGSHNESIGTLNMSAGQILQSTGPGVVGLGVTTGIINIGNGSATINGGLRSANNYVFTVAGSLTVNGVIGAYANNASTGMLLTGGGTMSISGVCPMKTVDIQQGILKLSQGGSFNGSNASVTVESGGTFALNGQTMSIGDLIGSGAVALGAGNLTINCTGTTFSGTINGTGSFTKFGAGKFNLTGNDLTSGANTISSGVLTVGPAGSIGGSSITVATSAAANINGTINNIPAVNAYGTINLGANPSSGFFLRAMGPLTLGSAGQFNVAPASVQGNRTLLVPGGLSLSGQSNSWSGQLDLSNNDMIVRGGSLSTVTNQIKSGYKGGAWTGTGIVSSAAAADSTHLTALGVIQNDNGSSAPIYGSGAPTPTFDGYTPIVSDLLIKFTYVGDANLDGVVDGSDYSRIDNGFLGQLTGWYNGDFNYDGVVNGSDYTLIDNAFNTQGASLAAINAASTAQVSGGNSVPEPAAVGLFSLAAISLLKRRRYGAIR